MKSFIKLKSLLSKIPKALFEESNEAEFSDWMLDGLKLLPQVVYYEPKIELFEIVDGKVQLPNYVKQVNNVTWQFSDPTKSEIEDISSTTTSTVTVGADQVFIGSAVNTLGTTLIPSTGTGGSCVITQFNCTVAGITTKLKSVNLTLTHPFVGELEIYLLSPNGECIPLTVFNGSGADYTNTVFIDSGALLSSGTVPFTGNFKTDTPQTGNCPGIPPGSYPSFEDMSSGQNGQWQLLINDAGSGNTGDMVNWSLSFEPEPATTIPELDLAQNCIIPITYKQWLDSPYYKNNYKVLKYIGTDKSLISNSCECLRSSCSETFAITPEKTMYLSLDTGFICVTYESPVCDEDGNLLIPDSAILHKFLTTYAIYKHWENRQFTKEEQAGNFYQSYQQQQALLLRQAKGDHLLRNFNIANVLDITGGQYKKLIKIPELLYYVR